MSATLGPIHLWLYNKIIFQDELTSEILDYAQENCNGKGNLSTLDEQVGKVTRGDLANIIDETNIHGWLQEQVSISERRLASIVTGILQEKPDCLEEIKKVAFAFGQDHAIDSNIPVEEVYHYLETILLNGMPCDGVNQIVSQTDTVISWIQTVDIHKTYWDEVGGNVDNYYAIRENLCKGILENSEITYEQMSEQAFELRKEE